MEILFASNINIDISMIKQETSVLGFIAEGLFAVGQFAVGYFTVGTVFRGTDCSKDTRKHPGAAYFIRIGGP